MKVMHVYVVLHVHEFADGHEDVKLIGVYATETEANNAVRAVADQPGFRDHKDGFSIDKYPVGATYWQEGFITVDG